MQNYNSNYSRDSSYLLNYFNQEMKKISTATTNRLTQLAIHAETDNRPSYTSTTSSFTDKKAMNLLAICDDVLRINREGMDDLEQESPTPDK